jgi:hypothetical protein
VTIGQWRVARVVGRLAVIVRRRGSSLMSKVITGTAFPLAADYYHGYRLELDQVFVCHDKHRGGKTLRVGFPDAMDAHLRHGDAIGLCPGDAPL